MTPAIATVLVLLVLAVVLFSTERIPIDIVAIVIVVVLIVTKTLTVDDAFAGFGNNIVITIAGLFIITGGLVKTGVADTVGRSLHQMAGNDVSRLTLWVMVLAGASAAVLKNTTTTAMLLPVVLGVANRAQIQASKLLMPLAFGAILGGTCTLIGTSTNLAVSGLLPRYGMPPFSMFELTPIGIALVGAGLVYMVSLGSQLLPDHKSPTSLAEEYHIREYLSEVIVLPNSRLVGKTLADSNLRERLDLNVVGIVRDHTKEISPEADFRIASGDLLLVQGRVEDILRIKNEVGIEIRADFKLSDKDLKSGKIELFELMLLGSSDVVGSTFKASQFRDRFGLTVLAINRHSTMVLSKISRLVLRFGDVLLVQGTRANVERFVAEGNLLLSDVTDRSVRHGKRRFAIAALVVFLICSITQVVPLSVAVLISVLILVATRAVLTQEMYEMIEWRLLVLIAGMMSFGTAMEKTGTDKYLADWIVHHVGGLGGKAVLAGFFLLTVILTQPMSNQAAALVVMPVAIKTAQTLGLDPRTFAITITYAASCSFLTPLEPACVLIYTPGRYRFVDFIKIGFGLTVIMFVVVMWLVPYFWPLN